MLCSIGWGLMRGWIEMSTGLVFLSHLTFARGFDTDVHTYLRHTGMSSCPLNYSGGSWKHTRQGD